MKFLHLNHTHLNLFRLLLRAIRIVRRYGFSTRKMEAKLDEYVSVLREYGISSTFLITARILKRHPRIIEKYSRDGIEFAIHGYQHIDYSRLSEEKLSEHLGKSIDLFKKNSIPFSGFRFPYLKYDQRCMNALSKFPIKWDSSSSIYWDVMGDLKAEKMNWQNYEGMLNQYDHKNSSSHISLPRVHGNLLEIPVSLPDDDLLERFGAMGNGLAKEIWGAILSQTYLRGELFALQLHPERIFIFKEALVSLIKSSKELFPKVWIPKLSEICEWWEEKKDFSVTLNRKSDGEFEVDVNCSPRATLLARSDALENGHFFNGFSILKERKFLIKSQSRPFVGIPERSSAELREFLKNEGFIYEISEKSEEYSVYLDNFDKFSEEDEIKAVEIINSDNSPLIRFWRWPEGARSCLSVTGDIDSITIYDFADRHKSGPMGIHNEPKT